MEYLPFLQAKKGNWTGEYVARGVVDQRPWQTAAAPLCTCASLPREGVCPAGPSVSADHEVDQACLPIAPSGQRLKSSSSPAGRPSCSSGLNQLQETIKGNDRGSHRMPSTTGIKSGDASSNASDLEVAKAQLGLESESASRHPRRFSLRESGDQRSKIQQELAARQAAMQESTRRTQRREMKVRMLSPQPEQYTHPRQPDLRATFPQQTWTAYRSGRTTGECRHQHTRWRSDETSIGIQQAVASKRFVPNRTHRAAAADGSAAEIS